MKGLLRYILALAAMLLVLSGCSGGGSCASCTNGNSPNPTALTLALNAPNQYPTSSESQTAYLTITNTSGVSATNLTYTVPRSTNYTFNESYPADITVDPNGAGQGCANLSAGESCTFTALIPAYALPGSFTVIATSSSSQTGSLWTKAKSLVGIKSTIQLSLTANIGLINSPVNSESGANGITFLYAQTVSANPTGPTQVIIVAQVNSASAGAFNTIALTDANGYLLSESQLSPATPGGLNQGNVVTFLLNIPNGITSPYIFYGQTLESGTVVNQGTIANPINLVANGLGVLAIQPNLFILSPTHESQIITYTNIGTGAITNLALTPSSNLSPGTNTTTNPCTPGMTLAPVTATKSGGSCTYVVQYNPAQPATGAGNVLATYSNGQANESGYAYVTLPGLSISSGTNPSLTFTSNVGAATESSTITLTNTGASAESNIVFTLPTYFTLAPAANNSCTLSGANLVSNSLAANASCNLTLVYTNSTITPVSTANLVANYNYGSGLTQNGTTSVVVSYSTIAAPTAKPFVSAVFNTPEATAGNGSLASPFQIEQSNTPSTITLVYSNNGNAAATGFTVNENSLPNGYTFESSTCIGVNLAANQVNTCYVQLLVALDTPESQNLSLESAVISANWSDYQSYTNQSLNWVNTAAATTQNAVYLNVYQQPVVNLSLSSSADGSTVVSTVVQGGTYYLVYRLIGGYNVESAIYSTTLPAGMSFVGGQQTCTVSSSVTTCIIQVNAGNTLGNFPLNVSGGAGSVPTATVPNPLSIQVVKLTYAYILNDDAPNNGANPTVSQCLVSAVDGSLSGCVSFGDNDAFANASMASPAGPSAMAIGESTLFITNYYDDNTVTTFSPIISCPLSESNGSLNNCTYLTSASMGLTDTDMIEPDGIAIESGIAYISAYNDPNQDFGVMYTCNVSGSALTNCVMSSTSDPTGVAQYIYDGVDGNSTTSDIAVNGTNTYFNPVIFPGYMYLGYCDLFGLNCNAPNTTGLAQFTDPFGSDGMALYANGLIYPGDNYDFTNPQPGSYSSIVFCDLGLINCNPTGSLQIESYIAMPAVYNKYIYLPITDFETGNFASIGYCPITNDGTNTTISSSCSYTGSNINSILSDPLYIVFGYGSLPPVAPPAPPLAPVVTGSLPESGATGVFPTTVITVVFNESMNTSTLIPANFVLTDNTTPVALESPVYSNGNTVVTFTLASALNNSDTYYLSIPTPANILSAQGAQMKSGGQITYFTTSPSSTPSCSGGAYVLDSSTNSLTNCDVNADGSFTNCGATAISSFNNPQSFYYDADYGIYAVNQGNSTLSWYNTPGIPSPTATTGSNFNSPTGVSASPVPPLNLGVIINGNGSLTACRVADTGINATNGLYTNCVESIPEGFSSAAYGVAVFPTTNFGVVYTTNKSVNTVSLCPIIYAGGVNYTVGNTCYDSGVLAGTFNGPSGISANESLGYVLITNSGNNTVEKCTADLATGALSNCAPTATDATAPVFNQPNNIYEDLVSGDNKAYITNSANNSVTVCTDTNGTLSGCQVMTDPSFQGPTAVYSVLVCGVD